MAEPRGFKFGLGCNCCEPDCNARFTVVMSDGQNMNDSGVTVTLRILQGATEIVEFGPSSPAWRNISYTTALSSSTTYTAELTVEQAGGTTCTFTREFTTPAVCRPFALTLYIPRVWVSFGICNANCASLTLWGMPVTVTGPGSFSISGNTTEYPDPPPIFAGQFPPLRFAFTPCAEGDYVVTGTTTVPNTTTPTKTVAVEFVSQVIGFPPIAHTGTQYSYWVRDDEVSGGFHTPGDTGVIVPISGYTWPAGCDEPVPTTLYLTSAIYGSATLTSTGSGTCGGVWTGSSTGEMEACGGGLGTFPVNWTLTGPGIRSPSVPSVWTLVGGIPSGLCFCSSVDSYGRSVCRPRAGDASYGGVGVENDTGVQCDDCYPLDLSFSVIGRIANQFSGGSELFGCPPGPTSCEVYDFSGMNDTVTITA
jgi:hypothetical protein